MKYNLDIETKWTFRYNALTALISQDRTETRRFSKRENVGDLMIKQARGQSVSAKNNNLLHVNHLFLSLRTHFHLARSTQRCHCDNPLVQLRHHESRSTISIPDESTLWQHELFKARLLLTHIPLFLNSRTVRPTWGSRSNLSLGLFFSFFFFCTLLGVFKGFS